MYKKVTYVIRLLKSQSLQISILQHIAQDILHFILTSTHLRNFFSGDEGDLPVGFPDRFNSSFILLFTRGILCLNFTNLKGMTLYTYVIIKLTMPTELTVR